MIEGISRLGLLIPSADLIVELDFKNFLPDDVAFHTGRMFQGTPLKVSIEALNRILESLEPTAISLAQADPHLICFCCTSASFLNGPGWDLELANKITAITAIPATTTSTAITECLKYLHARRIFMITPYPEEFNKREIKFLQAHDIEVVQCSSFDCPNSLDIPSILPDQIVERARSYKNSIQKVDALFISCTNLRGMEIIESLETELGVPVLSSNQATMWHALRLLNINGTRRPAGRLLRQRTGQR